MKRLLSILTILVLSLIAFITLGNFKNLKGEENNKSLLALNETINSSDVSLLISTINDSEKQLSTDGTRILNTINETKSNLESGVLAIDIIITNPAGATKKEVIGVKISYDTYILENFDIIDISATKGDPELKTDSNEVWWGIASIETNEIVTLSYKLKLKSTVNKDAINKRLNTNRQIIVTEWGKEIGTYPSDSQIGVQICSPTIRLNVEEPTKGNLTVTKTVTGLGANTNKIFNFTVTLSDRNINGTYGDMTFTNGVANITLKHNQTLTASNLPANITYRVVETEANQNNYITSYTKDTGTIKVDETVNATFTNTYKMPVGNLSVKKVVDGSAKDPNKIFNFTVTLSDKSINGIYGDMSFTNGVARFTLKNDQTLSSLNLPIDITYTVEETDANTDGYVTIYDDGLGHRTTNKVTGSITENSNINIVVYNTKENKNFITVSKQFDTTSNFNKDIEITYESLQNNGINYETYKKYIANKKITIIASNGNTHTSFEVTANSNGKFIIPAKYSSSYKTFNVNIENTEGTLSLNINVDKIIPSIPNSIDYLLSATNTSTNTTYTKDFTLSTSESYIKSFELDFNASNLTNIKVTEKTTNNNWKFSYKVETNGNNISILMNNKAGEYKVNGSLDIETTPKPKITIEKVWNTLDNYIDIYFSSEHRNNFKIDVEIVDNKGRTLEKIKLDETGHALSKNKYSSNQEIYVLYPDGKKVRVNNDETVISKEIKVDIENEIYILSSSNNWKMTITKDINDNFTVEEIDSPLEFTSEISKTKDNDGNYNIKLTNTHLSTRNVSYIEPEKPIENPKTSINSYYIIGAMITLIATTGLIFLKRKNVF